MSTDKVLEIIDKLQDKLNNHRPFHMNINNINNNFQNISNNNLHFRPSEEAFNYNNNFSNNINLKKQDYLREDYIKKLIKEEFSELIIKYQSDILGQISFLDLKVNNLSNKMNDMNIINQKGFNMGMNFDNINNKNINYEKKIMEMEFKLSEFESFFKSWKELLKKNEFNLNSSMDKYNKDQEYKFMQLEAKINDELNNFFNTIKEDINNLKNDLIQIKNSEIDINKLEGEIKTMKVDFDYINKKVKSLMDSEIKKNLNDINQKNNEFNNEINMLKKNIENIKNDINNFLIANKTHLKISQINQVEELKPNEENNDTNNNIDNNKE